MHVNPGAGNTVPPPFALDGSFPLITLLSDKAALYR
jgi:hypothetical protein